MSIGRLQTEADLKRFGDQYWGRPAGSGVALVDVLPANPKHGTRVLYRPSVGVIWQVVFDQDAHNVDGRGWVVLGGVLPARMAS